MSLALCAGGAAAAEEPAKAKPHVMVCAKDGMTERALKREYGAAVWTTSAEVLAAVKAGEGWTAPRCMTNLENWRLTNELQRLRRAELARAKAQQLLASR